MTPSFEGLNDDFRDLITAFVDCGVEFVVVGAFAPAFHGAPRASGETDFEQPGKVYQIGLPPRRIDILTEISGVTFTEAWASSVTADLEGRAVRVIGKDAFIKNKQAAGRPKDLADVARLGGVRRDRP
jgi:hypothetical protein